MPNFHGIADKTKAFFERLTRRRRSRNGNQPLTGYQEGESEQGPRPLTKGDRKPLPPITGDSATNVVHASASGSEVAHSFQHSAHGGVNVVQGSIPPPFAVVSPHSTPQPSALPPVFSDQLRLQDPPSTPSPPPPRFAAKPTSHALQSAAPNSRRVSSSPSLSNTPAHSPHAPSATSNYFPNASGFNIGQVNTNVHNVGSSKTVFEYLEPHISHGAAYNSDERSDAPTCDPETRVAVQEDIVSWMREGDGDEDPKQIMWLGGPAGSGKTAIAGSVAEICRKEGLLAATFFFSSFSGSADRHSKRCVVITLAQHLAGHDALHEYEAQLLTSIKRHPDIFRKRLREQAQYLLIEPFRTVKERGSDRTAWPKSIMLDGLDEVLAEKRPNRTAEDLERAHEDDQLEILDVLLTLVNDPDFPFRIFVSSRPERVISEFFLTSAQTTALTLFLDSKYEPDADIERFLWSKFAGIRRRYRIASTSWPGQEAVDKIVEMSSGQFIVPATIVRHIEAGVPQRQLEDVVQLKWEDAGRRNPFAIVDALYTCIFHRSSEPSLAAKWLRVYTSRTRGRQVLALYFQRLVEDVEGEFHHVLGPLSSLVSIPMPGDQDAPLKIYHKSLSDFLSSQRRSGDLYLDNSSMEAFVAARCIGVIRSKGPAVPIYHISTNLSNFLDEFYGSTLLNFLGIGGAGGFTAYSRDVPFFFRVSRSFKDSLVPMSKHRGAELARCDVAWWTCLCLAQSPYETKHYGMAFIMGMYSGIHVNICRSKVALTACHAACTHWRKGILAEAKALNWCVHGLEQADLGELAKATKEWFDERFKKMGEQEDGSVLSCAICQPNVTTS